MNFLFSLYGCFLRSTFGYSCRFYPTCSCYSHQAFKTYDPLKASVLTLYRLLRCHPLSRGGYDPLPAKREILNG